MRSAAGYKRGGRRLRGLVGVLGVGVPLVALAGADVDWRKQVLQATGQGPPDVKAGNLSQARLAAERSAKEHAFAELWARAQSLPLRPDRTVGDAVAQEDTRRQVEQVLRGYRVLHKRYYSDGGVQWEVEVPLGALAAVLAPPEAETRAPASEPREPSASSATGLVVDARKLGMTPLLAPRLLDATTGTRLYSFASLGAEARRDAGVAGFFPSLEEARKEGRVGARPLVIEAARLDGADLQLGPAEAHKLAGLDPRLLTEGRVAILVQ